MNTALTPVDFDRDTGAFFQAAKEQRLVYRHCNSCNRGTHPPTQYCKHCGSGDTDWKESEGRGRLYSWTRVEHTVLPAYPAPYAVVVVSLSDAPDVRLIGRINGTPELHAGQPMTVVFETVGDEAVLPNWVCA